MKKLAIVFLAALAFVACEKEFEGFEEPEVRLKSGEVTANYEIVEGHGIVNNTGNDIVILGMTRGDIISTYGEGSSGSDCVFKIEPLEIQPVIRVYFDGENEDVNDQIIQLRVSTIHVPDENTWPTSGGVTNKMLAEDVAELYPGSVLDVLYGNNAVVYAKEYGYTYRYQEVIVYGKVQNAWSEHYIYPKSDGTDKKFEGNIVVENPSKKTSNYTVEIEITDPVGVKTNGSFTAKIPGKGTISKDPGEFVDVNGIVGEYHYTATLLNEKGRNVSEVGTSTGSFKIVEI